MRTDTDLSTTLVRTGKFLLLQGFFLSFVVEVWSGVHAGIIKASFAAAAAAASEKGIDDAYTHRRMLEILVSHYYIRKMISGIVSSGKIGRCSLFRSQLRL